MALSELVNQRINFNDFDADFIRHGLTRLHEFPSLRCMVVCPTIAGIPQKPFKRKTIPVLVRGHGMIWIDMVCPRRIFELIWSGYHGQFSHR